MPWTGRLPWLPASPSRRTVDGAALTILGGSPACGAMLEWWEARHPQDGAIATLAAQASDQWSAVQGFVLPYPSGRQCPAPDPAARVALVDLPDDPRERARAVLQSLVLHARWMRETADLLAGSRATEVDAHRLAREADPGVGPAHCGGRRHLHPDRPHGGARCRRCGHPRRHARRSRARTGPFPRAGGTRSHPRPRPRLSALPRNRRRPKEHHDHPRCHRPPVRQPSPWSPWISARACATCSISPAAAAPRTTSSSTSRSPWPRSSARYASGFLADGRFGFDAVRAALPPSTGLILAVDALDQLDGGPVEETPTSTRKRSPSAPTGVAALKLLRHLASRRDSAKSGSPSRLAIHRGCTAERGVLSVLEPVVRAAPGETRTGMPMPRSARPRASCRRCGPDLYKAQVPLAGAGRRTRAARRERRTERLHDRTLGRALAGRRPRPLRSPPCAPRASRARAGSSPGRALWSDIVGSRRRARASCGSGPAAVCAALVETRRAVGPPVERGDELRVGVLHTVPALVPVFHDAAHPQRGPVSTSCIPPIRRCCRAWSRRGRDRRRARRLSAASAAMRDAGRRRGAGDLLVDRRGGGRRGGAAWASRLVRVDAPMASGRRRSARATGKRPDPRAGDARRRRSVRRAGWSGGRAGRRHRGRRLVVVEGAAEARAAGDHDAARPAHRRSRPRGRGRRCDRARAGIDGARRRRRPPRADLPGVGRGRVRRRVSGDDGDGRLAADLRRPARPAICPGSADLLAGELAVFTGVHVLPFFTPSTATTPASIRSITPRSTRGWAGGLTCGASPLAPRSPPTSSSITSRAGPPSSRTGSPWRRTRRTRGCS